MDCQAPILPILGKPTPHVGLVSRDDASRVPSLALSIAPCRAGSRWWVRPPLAHLPAFRIDGQSLPEGRGISWFTQGWELHPSSAVKLSGAAGPSCRFCPSSPGGCLFRGNGSHPFVHAEERGRCRFRQSRATNQAQDGGGTDGH